MIRADGLSRAFGQVRALRGVDFTAADGRITGILGPNGAGKTTALRILCGLLRPDAGRIQVDGLDPVSDAVAVRRRLGVLPDQRGLYQRLTARENIRYFGALHGLRGEALEVRIGELLRWLDMDGFADRRTAGFSQGQRVKVAIARALVHDPGNVVLDEPTNGLDVMSTRAMREVLRGLRGDGRCVLFCTHIMQEAAALCDELVILARGRVVASGTPEAIRARTGRDNLEDAFVSAIGSEEGLLA